MMWLRFVCVRVCVRVCIWECGLVCVGIRVRDALFVYVFTVPLFVYVVRGALFVYVFSGITHPAYLNQSTSPITHTLAASRTP
jgi:hypothetical protein